MNDKGTPLNASAVNIYLVDWLKKYAEQAGVDGFVVGVSGGVDSALTAVLCAQTGLPTACIEMPIHQPQSHVDRAWEGIHNLKERFSKVEGFRVDLTHTFDMHCSALGLDASNPMTHLALANTRSRLRMTTLYAHAQTRRALVVGTGNKIEDFGVGFFTKYGDGGVDISPIADLTKSEVYLLARFVGVSESILNAPPSDGLWHDDRSDEDQMGASYPELEWAMEERSRGIAHSPEWSTRQQEVMAIFVRLNGANQHKMCPIPVATLPENVRNA